MGGVHGVKYCGKPIYNERSGQRFVSVQSEESGELLLTTERVCVTIL